MTRPLYSPPRPVPVFSRNRRISPRQAEMLESLWNARLRRAAPRLRPERPQEERFRHIAETIGRTVEHAGELSWREANRVLRRLLDEVRSASTSPAGDGPAAKSARSAPSAPRKLITTISPKTPPTPASETRSGKNAGRCKTRKGGPRSHD